MKKFKEWWKAHKLPEPIELFFITVIAVIIVWFIDIWMRRNG